MSYTPTTWTTGDTITASAMNKIEQGIANGGSGALICNTSYNGNTYVLDKTTKEIYDALLAGIPAYIKFQYGNPYEDYVGSMYIAPIIRITNYNYASSFKIYASRPTVAAVSSYYGAGVPSVLVYTSDGFDDYPTYYVAVDTDNTAVLTGGID